MCANRVRVTVRQSAADDVSYDDVIIKFEVNKSQLHSNPHSPPLLME